MTQKNGAIQAAMDELHMYLPDKPTEMLAYITEDVISRYEAALAVAPDHAPNDAAFEAAVGDWSDSLFDHGPGSARDSMTKYQRILALHRQAKHAGYVAGLTELRTIIQNRMDHFPQSDEAGEPNILWPGNELACMMLLDKIKSMLKDATDAR